MSDWDPRQYERFKDERSRAFFDLLALVRSRPGMRVADLGCGTGELTREMHRRLRAASTLGIDSSASMLAQAETLALPGLRFERRDIAEFAARGEYDLVFSNAAVQWVDDHAALFPRLAEALGAAGQFAVQVPANHDHPSHTAAADVAAEEPFRSALAGHVRTSPVLAPEDYSRLLHRLGFREQHVRLQVYGHELASRDEVVEWVRGTLLTDYSRRLPADLFERFLARYREALLPRLQDVRPYFYPFKRILMWGAT